jgi:hypothetical protein
MNKNFSFIKFLLNDDSKMIDDSGKYNFKNIDLKPNFMNDKIIENR